MRNKNVFLGAFALILTGNMGILSKFRENASQY